MGDSRKPKARQLREQWERGRWACVSHGWGFWKMKKDKKKKTWQQLWTVMSKNIYFSLQTLRRGLREQGRESNQRYTETETVRWFTEGCRTGMCFAKTLTQHETTNLNTRVNDDHTSATSQIRDWSQMCHRFEKGMSFVIRGQAVARVECKCTHTVHKLIPQHLWSSSVLLHSNSGI